MVFLVEANHRVPLKGTSMQSPTIERSELRAALAAGRSPVLLEALAEGYYNQAHLDRWLMVKLGPSQGPGEHKAPHSRKKAAWNRASLDVS
jgi:hypothetical protein